ncbi:MAG: ethylbenzene dehydrogenase-related protein [Rhodobacteraceae bacterium]|nr:ethylbenzene dehydrogenase-related protein [Paracoccaceae bacterium]
MKRAAFVIGVAVLVAGPALATEPDAITWSQIPTKDVTLFFPGETSYQWLRSAGHKNPLKGNVQGQRCISCHQGQEAALGNKLVQEGPLEPTPIADKNGVLNLAVQAAHDDEYLYFRFQWKTNMDREGRMHNMVRYDGTGWQWFGGHRAEDAVIDGAQPPIYEDRLAIMLDDGSVPGFAEQGCWLACHDSMRDMQEPPDAAAVRENFYLGAILNKKDVRKFLPLSRTDEEASWDTLKTPGEIAELKAAGQFLDLMQWRAARSNPVGMADDGYVLEYRLFDAGRKMFSWNIDKKTMTPKFMFDEAKVGFSALRVEDFTDSSKPTFIIEEQNATPYDPNAGFQEGDILPGRLLSAQTEGSAGDNDWAKGTWKDSMYTVVFRRKLDTGNPLDDKILEVGGVYTIGLSVHDDNVTTRFHQVSFPLTLGIGTKADIEAVTLK